MELFKKLLLRLINGHKNKEISTIHTILKFIKSNNIHSTGKIKETKGLKYLKENFLDFHCIQSFQEIGLYTDILQKFVNILSSYLEKCLIVFLSFIVSLLCLVFQMVCIIK